jgi:uncharacterized membrane protein YfcA
MSIQHCGAWLAVQTGFAIAVLGAPETALAQASSPPPVLSGPTDGQNLTAQALWRALVGHTSFEIWLTLLVVCFGVVVLSMYLHAVKSIRTRRVEDISRAMIIMMVITGSMVLITVGYRPEQIAPAFGLFGTIVGYMLGRMADNRINPAPFSDTLPDASADDNQPLDNRSTKIQVYDGAREASSRQENQAR